MTEREWLECVDPEKMLELLREKVSDRKMRLFAVACCQRAWHLLTNAAHRNAIEVAECLADGAATRAEVDAALASTRRRRSPPSESRTVDGITLRMIGRPDDPAAVVCAAHSAYCVVTGPEHLSSVPDAIATVVAAACFDWTKDGDYTEQKAVEVRLTRSTEVCRQASLLREIVSSPFRPITLDRSRLTATALAIAQAIYEERQFDRLPILADALEEAGLVQPDLLNHCRQPGDHVKGCWAVDLVLGKE